ncbi:MAG: phosphatidate cytidylyltransferase, partial [Azonexus sp.]
MLKTRVITALILLALVLPSLFFLPQAYWALLVALFIGVAVWEWGGLLGLGQSGRLALGVAMAGLCSAVSLTAPAAIGVGSGAGLAASWVIAAYVVAAAFWCVVVPLWLRSQWRLPRGLSGLIVGLVVLFPAWLALVQVRVAGPGGLLAILAIVWMADVAAYFSGKRFG